MADYVKQYPLLASTPAVVCKHVNICLIYFSRLLFSYSSQKELYVQNFTESYVNEYKRRIRDSRKLVKIVKGL